MTQNASTHNHAASETLIAADGSASLLTGESSSVPAWFDRPAIRIPAFLVMITAGATEELFHSAAFSNTDVWWHLRTGAWILHNHVVPRTGFFSQYSRLPWCDPSWGYDALLGAGYGLMGLAAFPVLLIALRVALAWITFLLAGGWRGNFWTAVALSAAAQYLTFNLAPLPSFFSVLFFGVELILIFRTQPSGDKRPLRWFPLLFLVWANLDIQFVIGLCVLALTAAAKLTEWVLSRRMSGRDDQSFSRSTLGAVVGASFLATLLNPYGFHIYADVLGDVYSKTRFRFFAEMMPMNFRSPRHYALLLLVMAAFFAIGRRRSWDLTKLSVMVATTLLAFRVGRDTWCVLLPAIAVLANTRAAPRPRLAYWRYEKALAVVLVAVLVAGAASWCIVHSGEFSDAVAHSMPIKAADFVRANHLPQPLFNSFAWGGFLIWYLPEYPVSIDGRVGLYGEKLIANYDEVETGRRRLDTAPQFADARTILLQKQAGLATALTFIPALRSKYRLVYSDDIAVVLVRNVVQ